MFVVACGSMRPLESRGVCAAAAERDESQQQATAEKRSPSTDP